jgi:hypothetical protein
MNEQETLKGYIEKQLCDAVTDNYAQFGMLTLFVLLNEYTLKSS